MVNIANMDGISKNEQIVKFIIERLSGRLGRTHLLKLIYLVDYHSCRLFGKPISTFVYRWHKHGPFDEEFYGCFKGLEPMYIREEEVAFPSGNGYVFHNVPAQIEYKNLSAQEMYVLEYIIKTYGKVKLQTLLDEVVYKTEPMEELINKNAYGDRLPIELVNNLDKKLYGGLDPANIVEGEKAAQEGKVRSLEEVFSALQGRDS